MIAKKLLHLDGRGTQRTSTHPWGAGIDRVSGTRKIYFGWTKGYNYRQDWLTVFTLEPPGKVPRFQGRGNSSSVSWNATWNDCSSDAKVPCWACRRRCWIQMGTFKSILPTHATFSITRTRQFQTAGEGLHLSCECTDKAKDWEVCFTCTRIYQEQKRGASEHEDLNSASDADGTSPVAGIPSQHKQQDLHSTNSKSSYNPRLRDGVKPSNGAAGVPLTLTVALSILSW